MKKLLLSTVVATTLLSASAASAFAAETSTTSTSTSSSFVAPTYYEYLGDASSDSEKYYFADGELTSKNDQHWYQYITGDTAGDVNLSLAGPDGQVYKAQIFSEASDQPIKSFWQGETKTVTLEPNTTYYIKIYALHYDVDADDHNYSFALKQPIQ